MRYAWPDDYACEVGCDEGTDRAMTKAGADTCPGSVHTNLEHRNRSRTTTRLTGSYAYALQILDNIRRALPRSRDPQLLGRPQLLLLLLHHIDLHRQPTCLRPQVSTPPQNTRQTNLSLKQALRIRLETRDTPVCRDPPVSVFASHACESVPSPRGEQGAPRLCPCSAQRPPSALALAADHNRTREEEDGMGSEEGGRGGRRRHKGEGEASATEHRGRRERGPEREGRLDPPGRSSMQLQRRGPGDGSREGGTIREGES